MADDAAAFGSFNTFITGTWQLSHSGLVKLSIPNGSTCVLSGVGNCKNGSTCIADGIYQLLVEGEGATTPGSGATITSGGGSGFFLGGFPTKLSDPAHALKPGGICFIGIADSDGCSARIATVAAGATCLDIITSGGFTPAQLSARFLVGNYIVVAGIDPMGNGDPPNPQIYEYHAVTGVSDTLNCAGGSGARVQLAEALSYSYKSTWPNFYSGGSGNSDNGGPGTIYNLGDNWNIQVEYRGLTLDQPGFQIDARGRDITYRNVKVTSGPCILPTMNQYWRVYDSDLSICSMEVDKVNQYVLMQNVTIDKIDFQSSSVYDFNLNNVTATTYIKGGGKLNTLTDVTTPELDLGAHSFGWSGPVICTRCDLPLVTNSAVNDQGAFQGFLFNHGIQNAYQMSGGVIKQPRPQTASAAASGTGGVIRLTVPSTAAWVTNMTVPWQKLTGGTCPDDVYLVTVVDSTHIELQGTTFSSTCTGVLGDQLPRGWFVLGANVYWSGSLGYTSPAFQITDLSQDSTFTYITTSLAGGFPAIPLAANGWLGLELHPAPQLTCNNCTGAWGLQFNQWPSAIPFGSYWIQTINQGTPSSGTYLFGGFDTITFDVTTAYTGGGSPNINLDGPRVINSTSTGETTINPTVNPKNPGGTPHTVTMTPSTVTGTQSGDSVSAPGNVWIVPGQITIQFSSSVAGDPVEATVTIQTDQGVVYPPP